VICRGDLVNLVFLTDGPPELFDHRFFQGGGGGVQHIN
jgi:hypothetical protein